MPIQQYREEKRIHIPYNLQQEYSIEIQVKKHCYYTYVKKNILICFKKKLYLYKSMLVKIMGISLWKELFYGDWIHNLFLRF